MHRQTSFETRSSGKPVLEAAARESAMQIPSREATPRKPSIGSWVLLLLVRAYVVFLSPFLGGACKFYPSCSNYAREAIERHGARRGSVLALKRLLRCHPFTRGGFDFVPDELPSASRAAHAHLATSGQGKAQ